MYQEKWKRVDTTITYLEITTYVQIRWKLEGPKACIDKLQRKGFYQLCTYITKTKDILPKSKSMLLYVCLVFIFTANSQNYSARSLSINWNEFHFFPPITRFPAEQQHDHPVAQGGWCRQGRNWGGRLVRAPLLHFTLWLRTCLNRGESHFTLGLRPCIVSSFLS